MVSKENCKPGNMIKIQDGNTKLFPVISDISFGHMAIQMCMEYMEIDGRMDGDRRKNTKSNSASATRSAIHAAVLRTHIP